jgi:glutathione S-transferase
LRGVKLGGGEEFSELNFDVNAKLEEKERRSGRLIVSFVLTVGTKPSVVKFEVEGLATLEGKNPAIEKLLEVNPETKIPLLLHRIYQHVFTSTFLLATLLDASYPPPDLLFSGEMNKPRAERHVEWEAKKEKEKAEEKPEEKKKTVKPKPKVRRR